MLPIPLLALLWRRLRLLWPGPRPCPTDRPASPQALGGREAQADYLRRCYNQPSQSSFK